MAYAALIRTYNSQETLSATVQSLERQEVRPSQYVIIDSGSTDSTLDLVPAGAVIRPYIGEHFNYADALNQGIEAVAADNVLIISSHTVLENENAVSAALKLFASDCRIGAAYYCDDNSEPLRYDVIDGDTFDGFNGLWNSCSLVRVALLRTRGFRREVFAAEDQEWARWLFTTRRMQVARYSGAGMFNNNPRASLPSKRLNEYVAIAYFSNRRLLRFNNLARIGIGALAPNLHRTRSDRMFKLMLLWRLVACRFTRPKAASRYF